MKNQVWAFALSHLAGMAKDSRRRPLRVVVLFVLCVAMAASLATAAYATGNISKGDLAGAWVVSLTGTTGCGVVAMEATFTLSASGTGTATLTTHGACGDSTVTGQTFSVLTLSSNGSGTANLTCGTGCGWNFNIQVAPDRSTFSLVDVSTANPGNFLEGVAIHQ